MVAILLAFAANFLVGRLQTHNSVRRSIHAIAVELTADDASVMRYHASHVRKCAVLQKLAERGRGHVITYTNYLNALDAVLPFAPSPTEDVAWQLAETSGTSVNFDYTTRADLARVYQEQQRFEHLGDNLNADFRPLIYARDIDFFLVARNAALDCSYVTNGEERLTKIYRAEIAKLGP